MNELNNIACGDRPGDEVCAICDDTGSLVHPASAMPSTPTGAPLPGAPAAKCADHDWPEGPHGTDMDGSCTRCGLSFLRYIHTECP
jgi:hypothetical protein